MLLELKCGIIQMSNVQTSTRVLFLLKMLHLCLVEVCAFFWKLSQKLQWRNFEDLLVF